MCFCVKHESSRARVYIAVVESAITTCSFQRALEMETENRATEDGRGEKWRGKTASRLRYHVARV